MLGSSENPGVMYLTMKELFNRMDLIKEEKVFDIAFSYLEVIRALSLGWAFVLILLLFYCLVPHFTCLSLRFLYIILYILYYYITVI